MSSKAPTSRCRKTPLSDLASRKAQRNTRYIQVLTRAPKCSFFLFCSLFTALLTNQHAILALSPLSMRTWQALFSFLLLNNKQTNKKEGERKISKTKTNPKKKSQKHDMQNQTRNTQQTTQTYTAQHNTTQQIRV